MPRITKDPTERRQEILDTALKLFWEKGYEKTSMTEIAQAMQVAQGLCYRYFPSKEALFQTAVDQYAQRQVDQIASVLRKPGLTLVQVVEQMPTFLETEAEDSAIAKLCHGPESEKLHGPLSMAICAKLQPLVQQLLEKANERERSRLQTRRRPPLFVSMDSWAFYGIKRSVERREYAASRHFNPSADYILSKDPALFWAGTLFRQANE